MQPSILTRGSNDIASAIAHRLFLHGYAVFLHENPAPTTARRKMAFTDAVFDGRAVLDGVSAVRIDDLAALQELPPSPAFIPVIVQDFISLLTVLRPQVLVDARMRKHQQPECQLGLAGLTIGLGPNFVAGETVDLAVDTGWGDALGKVIAQGATSPLQGEPRAIAGHARDRYVYAPLAGTFQSDYEIGDTVVSGQVIAKIDATPLLCPISGRLRGLTRSGVHVQERTKVIEVDPRGDAAQVAGIAERPAQIAAGVLDAIQTWPFNPIEPLPF